MSRQYASQLLFEVKPSKTYLRIVVICAFLVFLSILQLNYFYPFSTIFLSAMLLFLLLDSLKNNVGRNLQWQTDGCWLITQDNLQQKAKLRSGSVVTSFFAVLNFKLDNNKTTNVILFKDNIDGEKFRQLRIRIKVEGI